MRSRCSLSRNDKAVKSNDLRQRDKKGIAARICLRGYALMLTKGRHICRIYRNFIQKSYVGDVAAVAAFSVPSLLFAILLAAEIDNGREGTGGVENERYARKYH